VLHKGEKFVLWNVVEVAFDVGVHHPCLACFELLFNAGYGRPGTAPGTKTITLIAEVPLEDRFDDGAEGLLHDAVAHGRDA
jgi:hypothetical protein